MYSKTATRNKETPVSTLYNNNSYKKKQKIINHQCFSYKHPLFVINCGFYPQEAQTSFCPDQVLLGPPLTPICRLASEKYFALCIQRPKTEKIVTNGPTCAFAQ